ncbi:SDR family oxidoreductase [Pelagovum pacificum]|uniref:DUF4166 domain-containing protein n=1 Tax=Pelagovum pacificum TaxID=2588711 RepID=A0A5C5GG89_9RHOB|nr:SDR family oxidoreductase [Pelagovum pacificum]QQA43164.1 DUF4166 domain-containing protein [Pelagovum pacificum]TNY33693.1 DUF4166 domain-containing protein [Pelagovum pacificum]
MTTSVLILGGYGAFGARLAIALANEPEFDVIVAGRTLSKAAAHTARHGGRPLQVDRDGDLLHAAIAAAGADIVVDAAGPFQSYGTDPLRVARTALSAGAHYVDLSDDAAFTVSITELDRVALDAGRVAISGASSVPAVSSAAVEALSQGITDLHLISSVILPGNRAPRGLSVMQAILAQAGRPLRIYTGDQTRSVPGWSAPRRERVGPLRRWSCLIGAPDLALFPEHYAARSVEFRAGLELKIMHFGLWFMSLPIRAGLGTLTPLARPLKRIADWMERFGTDTGAMRVTVSGLTRDGASVQREWWLIAGAGKGPEIPAIPAAILCRKLARGALDPGARPALGLFDLSEFEVTCAPHGITFERRETDVTPIFRQTLGPAFDRLPDQIRDLHTVLHHRTCQGLARVDRGPSLAARMICSVMGFPASGDRIPVTVTMERSGAVEHWTRNFAGRRFRSHLRSGADGTGEIIERFGPLRFTIALRPDEAGLTWPVTGGSLLGIPLPRRLLPESVTREEVQDARASFDVALSLPLVGPLIRYRGQLRSAGQTGAASSDSFSDRNRPESSMTSSTQIGR